jgi:methionine sulfoxide reductase heme-binding subunit
LIHGLFSVVGPGARGVPEALIPGLARVQTVQMAAGTIGLWLMLAVYASYALRGRIGTRAARRLHLLAYPAFIATTLHAVLLNHGEVDPVYVLSSVAVGLALVVRIGTLARR